MKTAIDVRSDHYTEYAFIGGRWVCRRHVAFSAITLQ